MALVVAVLLVALLGAQALAGCSAPPASHGRSTGATLGRTGFEYLGGLRKFAAAALWNRLDPQFHEYGNGKSIDERLEFLPTMRIVQMLDPQFEQTYYVSAFIFCCRTTEMAPGAGDSRTRGHREQPKVRVHARQLRAAPADPGRGEEPAGDAQGRPRPASSPGTTWANTDDQFEGYGIFRTRIQAGG